MSYAEAIPPSLFDLLGRSWSLGQPVRESRFSRAGETVAFRTDDGLALVAVPDPERPETRMRLAVDDGRRTIAPRRAKPRPVARATGTAGHVAAWGDKSFVTGLAGGGLASVTPRGQVTPLRTPIKGPLAAIARDPTSCAVAAAAGRQVVLLPDDRDAPVQTLDVPGEVVALALSPDGRILAAAQPRGVSLWRDGEALGVVEMDGPQNLFFSPCGRTLACPLAANALALVAMDDYTVEIVSDYPTPVASVTWTEDPPRVVTSGAFRVTAWETQAGGLGEPVEAGKPGLVVVDRVAAHRGRRLVAAGYASGLVAIVRPGTRDELVLRADGPAVTALAWSDDGGHLAIGDAGGGAALVALPAELFK